MCLAARLRPDPLERSPRPPNHNRGGVLLLRGREGRGWKGRGDGKREEGRGDEGKGEGREEEGEAGKGKGEKREGKGRVRGLPPLCLTSGYRPD